MDKKETKDEGAKSKSPDFGFAPMGHGMLELMNTCCPGQGGIPDCSTMMKGMMEAMRNQPCCAPEKDAAEFEGRTK